MEESREMAVIRPIMSAASAAESYSPVSDASAAAVSLAREMAPERRLKLLTAAPMGPATFNSPPRITEPMPAAAAPAPAAESPISFVALVALLDDPVNRPSESRAPLAADPIRPTDDEAVSAALVTLDS